MVRWLKTLLSIACWSFLLVGGAGLAEGISQWIRFDVLGGQNQPLGPLRLLAPYLVLYGWLGMVGGMLVFLPSLLISLRTSGPRRVTFALCVAGSLAFLAVVYAGYIGHTHLWPNWWEREGGHLVTLLLVAIWFGVVGLLFWPTRRLADWMARQKTRTLAFPAVVIIVATAHWPDWRQEGLQQRTGHLRRSDPEAATPAGAPNLILITIDTWRHDHLSLINPQAPPTPHLDDLARAGTLLTNTWSVSPWTLPSMASLMTGLSPRVLGSGKYVPLPSAVPTLAETAWRQGYTTAAFATNPYLTRWYGFDRGFEFFEHSLVLETLLPAERSVLSRELHRQATTRLEANSADQVVARAQRWLAWHRIDRPLFLWLHFMNPHLPYRWRDLPARDDGPGPVRGRVPDPAAIPDDDWFAGRQYRGIMHIRTGEFVPDAAQREGLRTLYAREVQFTDHWLGQLFTSLQQRGLWDNSVVAVLADHGEEFWEHDGFEHGHSVMPEVCRVPWILRRPAELESGQLWEAAVSTVDVLPTLCGLLNWPAPTQLNGRSLFGVQAEREPPATSDGSTRLICVENLLYGPQQQAWLRWPWLMVRSDSLPGVTWYDLDSDPGALQPLSPPPTVISFRAAAETLQSHWDRQAAQLAPTLLADREAVPADLQRRLEALGY